jgi:SpoVK/Ycf46/Vps4 family AAA+-type ATPase
MESFTGLAILTSNIRHNLDQAFLRRLRFVIEFPRPDTRARAAIWRLCLPAATHVLGERELALLARQAELTGGHIRQISLRAAFAAAAAGTRIDIDHLQHAANAELAKLGLPGIDLHLSEAA